jgi:CyaY protein
MSIEEPRFRQIVREALKVLASQIDDVDDDGFDAKISDGVLSVEFEQGGVFVLSQQVPVRELWLSAFSRAWHFRWADGAWSERDTSASLESVLTDIWTRKLGRPVTFANPGPHA